MPPATVITRESFPLNANETALDKEINLRIRAGAIRSKVEVTEKEKVLVTEWSLLGDEA